MSTSTSVENPVKTNEKVVEIVNKKVNVQNVVGIVGLFATVVVLGNNAVQSFKIKKRESARNRFNELVKNVSESASNFLPPVLNLASTVIKFAKK